jgi:CubicO group peptidase (beta-lactamase class C family)
MDESRLQRLLEVMREDIEQDRYFGGVIAIGRHGHLALHEAVGHADSARKRPVRKDSVFSLFSTTKAITVVLTLRAIERGQLALTTPISDVVTEFSGRGREAITIYHLLTHSSGLPSVWSAREGMYIDRLDEVIAEICRNEVIYPVEPPGLSVKYAPLVHHALMGEALRRIDPQRRSYRQIVTEDLLEPLGMKDTSIGVVRTCASDTWCPSSVATRRHSTSATAISVPTGRSRKSLRKCRGSAASPPPATCTALRRCCDVAASSTVHGSSRRR